MGTKFEDSFWETDFNGTLGFDLLCKKMREGQKVCHDIIEFMKKRSKADLQYSKTLKNIARTADGREEAGDLGVSWQALRAGTDKTAGLYEISAARYARIADDLSRFSDGARWEIKQIEDKVKDKQKMKRASHSKMVENQRSYYEKCRDWISVDNQLSLTKQSISSSTKDLEKVKVREDKAREAMEKSEQAYKQAVDTLEQIRVSWEADTEDGCKNFQRLEEERIYNTRDALWKCCNVDSQVCVDWDEGCEAVRVCLEKCDVQTEILNFIGNSRTGSDRPVPIEYSNYFDDNSKNKNVAPQSKHFAAPMIPRLCSGNDICSYPRNSANDSSAYSTASESPYEYLP